MKTLFKPIMLIVIVALAISCGGGSGKKGDAYISGTIKNAEGTMLYFEQLKPEGAMIIDSVKIGKDGSFAIRKTAHEMDYYRLRLGKPQSPSGYASPKNEVIFISDSTEKLTLSAEMDTKVDNVNNSKNKPTNFVGDPVITGSKQTDILNDLNKYLMKGEKTIDSLNSIYQQTPEKFNQVEGERIFNEVQADRAEYMRRFVDTNTDQFVALQALPFLNPDADLDRFKKVFSALNAKYPKNGWVVNLGLRVEQLTFLAIGTPAPDFSVLTPDDKPIGLKDFKGKYVLVDFWASWCKPCRMENPNVIAAYNKFKGKGFTVFGVSLDQNKDAWKNAIKDDGLVWQHGSDLKYWDSAPAKLYNVTSIPYNVLLDKEGKILAKNLHGPELEVKLAEVLK
jgi:peroxiredoxin